MNIGNSRRTNLALAMLNSLSEGRMSGAELAEATDTTPTYLPQVIAPLVREGWVRSNRGPLGGYELTEEGRAACLLDVIEAVQGPVADGLCVLRGEPCGGTQPCPAHTAWLAARKVLVTELAQVPAVTGTQDRIDQGEDWK